MERVVRSRLGRRERLEVRSPGEEITEEEELGNQEDE